MLRFAVWLSLESIVSIDSSELKQPVERTSVLNRLSGPAVAFVIAIILFCVFSVSVSWLADQIGTRGYEVPLMLRIALMMSALVSYYKVYCSAVVLLLILAISRAIQRRGRVSH